MSLVNDAHTAAANLTQKFVITEETGGVCRGNLESIRRFGLLIAILHPKLEQADQTRLRTERERTPTEGALAGAG